MKADFEDKGIVISDEEKFTKILELVKDRCTLLTDFWQQASFFYNAPENIDMASIKPKWNTEKDIFFDILCEKLMLLQGHDWNVANIETLFKQTAEEKGIKVGELQLPFRIMLVGGKFGPGVFDIAALIGAESTIERIKKGIGALAESV